MMGHGKHDSCMMCQMGKTIGMIEKCTDKNCTDTRHNQAGQGQQEHSMTCSKCGLKAKSTEDLKEHGQHHSMNG